MVESQQVLEWQAEARVAGEAAGRAAAVIGFLEARFQTVPPDLVKSIRSISEVARLTALVTLAGKAPSLDQFRADAGL
jgi:hypothetical protein